MTERDLVVDGGVIASRWRPFSTAPRDGTAFMARDAAGLEFPVFWLSHPERKQETRNWFGRITTIVHPARSVLVGAVPIGIGEYAALHFRGGDWQPVEWRPFDVDRVDVRGLSAIDASFGGAGQ